MLSAPGSVLGPALPATPPAGGRVETGGRYNVPVGRRRSLVRATTPLRQHEPKSPPLPGRLGQRRARRGRLRRLASRRRVRKRLPGDETLDSNLPKRKREADFRLLSDWLECQDWRRPPKLEVRPHRHVARGTLSGQCPTSGTIATSTFIWPSGRAAGWRPGLRLRARFLVQQTGQHRHRRRAWRRCLETRASPGVASVG